RQRQVEERGLAQDRLQRLAGGTPRQERVERGRLRGREGFAAAYEQFGAREAEDVAEQPRGVHVRAVDAGLGQPPLPVRERRADRAGAALPVGLHPARQAGLTATPFLRTRAAAASAVSRRRASRRRL